MIKKWHDPDPKKLLKNMYVELSIIVTMGEKVRNELKL